MALGTPPDPDYCTPLEAVRADFEGKIETLRTNFDAHVADDAAHSSSTSDDDVIVVDSSSSLSHSHSHGSSSDSIPSAFSFSFGLLGHPGERTLGSSWNVS